MQKGFIRIVEILIVAVMVFLVVLQFTQVPKQDTDWGNLELSTQANDILFSMDRKKVDWFSASQLNSLIPTFLSNNTVYSVRIKNSIKPHINVSCICTPAQAQSLRGALAPFEINGRRTEFAVREVSPSSIAFSHADDVAVVFDYSMAGNYTQIERFLMAGKGIIEFRGLDSSEMDSVQRDFFSLKWDAALPNKDPTSPLEFRSSSSSNPYFSIYKHFHSIPIYWEGFTSGAPGWSGAGWGVSGGSYQSPSPAGESLSFYAASLEGDYSYRAWLRFATATSARLILYKDPSATNTYVAVEFSRASNLVRVWNNNTGTPALVGSQAYAYGPLATWYDARIVTEGSTLKVYMNGTHVGDFGPVNTRATSQVGLGVNSGQAYFDSVRVAHPDGHIFSNGILGTEKIAPQDGNVQKVIIYQENTGLPACIASSNIVNGTGRAAWLASDAGFTQEINSTLRALVVWAAGDEVHIVKSDVMNVPVVASLYKVYDQDVYQPVEIVLSLGNLYK